MERQIKVLVIPSWYPPNGGYFFREQAVALAASGLIVDVLAGLHTSLKTLRPASILTAFDTTVSPCEGMTEHIRKYWIIPFSEKANFRCWVKMMVNHYANYQKKEGRPDIILAHSSIWAGWVAALINERFGVPYIITEHRSRFIFNCPEAIEMFRPWHYPYLQKAFEGASRVITVSDALQPYIKQISPSAGNKLVTIPNMVDTDFFTPSTEQKDKEPFRFFSLSNLIPLKGMDTLIEAIALLQTKYPGEFRLVIGGEGIERERLKNLTQERNLTEVVKITGRLTREEIRENMQLAHAFVLASLFEAFGVVYIEAFACGLPVVATRAGGPQGFIRESEGILVEPGNSAALAKAMHQIKMNYHLFDEQKIRKYAVTSYGRNGVANQYVELIAEIVKNLQV